MEGKATSKTKASVIVIAIFAIGFAAGALSMNLYQSTTAPTRRDGPRTRPQDYIVQKMTDKLNLTPEQRDQIKDVLNKTFSRYGEIRKDIEPRIDGVRQQGRDKIRAVLTEEQLPKFEEMIKEQDKEREKYDHSQKK